MVRLHSSLRTFARTPFCSSQQAVLSLLTVWKTCVYHHTGNTIVIISGVGVPICVQQSMFTPSIVNSEDKTVRSVWHTRKIECSKNCLICCKTVRTERTVAKIQTGNIGEHLIDELFRGYCREFVYAINRHGWSFSLYTYFQRKVKWLYNRC